MQIKLACQQDNGRLVNWTTTNGTVHLYMLLPIPAYRRLRHMQAKDIISNVAPAHRGSDMSATERGTNEMKRAVKC